MDSAPHCRNQKYEEVVTKERDPHGYMRMWQWQIKQHAMARFKKCKGCPVRKECDPFSLRDVYDGNVLLKRIITIEKNP